MTTTTTLVLLLLAVTLWCMSYREAFVTEEVVAKRPKEWPTEMRVENYDDRAWLSRIDAQAPFNPPYRDYILTVQAFYDKHVQSGGLKPKDTDVEAFLASSALEGKSVDKGALRKILVSAFKVDLTTSAALREEKSQQFKPSGALQPEEGVLEVWQHLNFRGPYRPADTSPPSPHQSPMPEGVYDVPPQLYPNRKGEDADGSPFYSVCQSGPCTENIW